MARDLKSEKLQRHGWLTGQDPFPGPENTTAPLLTGFPEVGDVLTCSTGVWTPAPLFYTYQWLRNGVTILGAVAQTYIPRDKDEGAHLSCVISATDNDGSNTAASNKLKITRAPAHEFSSSFSSGFFSLDR